MQACLLMKVAVFPKGSTSKMKVLGLPDTALQRIYVRGAIYE